MTSIIAAVVVVVMWGGENGFHGGEIDVKGASVCKQNNFLIVDKKPLLKKCLTATKKKQHWLCLMG